MNFDQDRANFINWKKVFLLFALASSVIPSDAQIDTYGSDLAYYGTCISQEDFQNVSISWLIWILM